jgi:Concanavalin A-like lectin/glucanases superfamily
MNCSTALTGPSVSVNGAASFCQTYLGHTIIAQVPNPGWLPPLASSVAVSPSYVPGANVWASTTAYAQWKEIIDSNGNLEVVKTAGTSGSGSHPTWPTTQGSTVVDGTVTWQLAMIGTQLAAGTGSALDAVSPEFFPGAGYGGYNNAEFEIANPANIEPYMTGAAAFTVEYYVNPLTNCTGNNCYLVGMEPGEPMASNIPAFQTFIDFNGHWQAEADIGGVRQSIRSTTPAVLGITQHIALTYDGATLRFFVAGVQVGSVAATGTWTIPP